MNQPLVSIIIPVYNRPRLLERAVASVRKQTYHNFECLIIDDGSTDKTADVAEKYAKKDQRFRLVRNEHAGGRKATNDGIVISKGDYVTLLGSDDEYLPEHLHLRVEELAVHLEIDILHGGMKVIGDEMVLDKRDLTKKISLYDADVFVGGTYFGKRSVFTDLHGFKQMDYASDSEFMVRALERFKVKRVDWPTYIYYRDHADSATKRLERKMQQHK